MTATLGTVASSYVAVRPPPTGYVTCPRTASNALRQTPDDAPVIDDLILVARLALDAIPTPGSCTICERWVTSAIGTNRFIWRFDTAGHVALLWAQAGATQTRTSVNVWPAAAGAWLWLRTTLDVDNGAAQHTVTHETSLDGNTWSPFEVITTGGVASVDGGSGSLAIGNRWAGSTLGLNGRVSDLIVRNAGATLFETHTERDLRGVAVDAATYVATSGHTVQVNRSGSPALTLVPPP